MPHEGSERRCCDSSDAPGEAMEMPGLVEEAEVGALTPYKLHARSAMGPEIRET